MLPGGQLQALVIANQGWWPLATSQEGGAQRYLKGHPGFVGALTPLQQQPEGSCMVSFLNGNSHAALSILQHPVPYDFILPGHENLGICTGFQPLPLDLIRRQLVPYQLETIAALYMMRLMLPTMRIIHVLPPPPSSAEQIMRVPEVFRDRLTDLGITPLTIRIKYYLLANQILREQMVGYGIELLDAPPASVGANGGLLDHYSAGATHGNLEYGQLVLDQLRTML